MITFDSPPSRFTKTGPLYAQIAEGILARIESGELSPGDRLPSERQLSRMLGVNRLTVRRALEMLASQGLLLRRQGDGTYVAEPKIERQAGRLVPFVRGMERRGYLPQAQVISLDKRPAGVAVAGQLPVCIRTGVLFAPVAVDQSGASDVGRACRSGSALPRV
jgi:GntR family transcriptional regulator